jgi:phytoene synthase
MTLIQSQPWEMRLLLTAQEAFNSQTLLQKVEADSGVLQAAYAYCEDITRFHSRTFYLASGLLPLEKRKAARALYAFCRITDDIIDEAEDDTKRMVNLKRWRSNILSDCPIADMPVCLAWADTQAKFNIPRGYAEQLIDGVARDIQQTRYETFADLAEYSYGVASTVGLMAMHIIGFRGEDALPYAIRLGVALQITNILRDVGEDWRNGRIYLPQDELREFGISETDIARGHITDNWRRFMAFQIERNRQLYRESIEGVQLLNKEGRLAITAAARLYEAILTDIEANDYDVFTRRASISTFGKIRRLPAIWRESRLETLA